MRSGEAEWYEGVSVEYVPGKNAVLTIYDNDIEVESIVLSDLPDKAAMHRLMVDKGFVKKSSEGIAEVQRAVAERDERERDLQEKKRASLKVKREIHVLQQKLDQTVDETERAEIQDQINAVRQAAANVRLVGEVRRPDSRLAGEKREGVTAATSGDEL